MPNSTIVAIIGGSGLYEIEGIQITERIDLDTPFGAPSAQIMRGKCGDVEVLFLPRHGNGHHLIPSEVNARANIYALKKLGAAWCIAVSAVGSLKKKIAPGDFVIPDQLIDRTKERPSTFFGNGLVAHISFADPFCPVARKAAYEICEKFEKAHDRRTHKGGTYVCMEGPAFSTRAESQLYRSWGADLIGMTMLPEAKLAREAELAYVGICLVSDYDCWNDEHKDVDAAAAFETLKRCSANAKQVLPGLIKKLSGLTPSPLAAEALKCALVTDLKQAPKETVEKLEPLLRKYL